MRVEELLRCQIQEWYPLFKAHTFTTLFHPLPDPFLRYLRGQPMVTTQQDHQNDDDVPPPPLFLLPRSTTGRDPLPRTTSHLDPVSLLDPDLSNLSDDDDEDDQNAPCFPDLEAAVERSISDLGGAAFPKLNWSAPKDATWISPDGSLRCSSFADVALLLRSSDSVTHDLSHSDGDGDDGQSDESKPNVPPIYYLALREWDPSLRPEMEFRCFVRRHRLVAVSQRDVTAFYPALLDRRLEIRDAIRSFFSDVVGPRFGSEDYTFDVYYCVSKRRGRGKVKLVDFNPWGAFTLPLLFSWEELEEDREEDGEVEFRVVESQCGVRPGLKTAVPYDYLDTGEGSGWDQFLRRADEELRRQAQHPDADCS
ncbi:uncharacterized protein [Typha latifolia]|uniref:uncharacterized protein n=1 Tax=Typha latifolia TaxID=4733 RepID=UPI003C2ED882